MTRAPRFGRCIGIAFACVVFGVGAALATTATAAAGAGSPAVAANVRAIQPAVSGLFQVHTPRVWADEVGELGAAGKDGIPDFLQTWDAFASRETAAILKDAYAFSTIDSLGHEILYAGANRTSAKPGAIVFELFSLADGVAKGEHAAGDLRIVVGVDRNGNLGTARFESFGEGGKAGFNLRAMLSGEGCSSDGTACIVMNGAVLEIGANLSLLGSKNFAAVKITTPEDSVVGILSLAPATGGCVSEVSGFKAGCTANDVQLTSIVPGSLNTKFCSNDTNRACANDAGCTGGGLCNVSGNNCTGDPNSPGTVKFSAVGRFLLTTQTRYDVGLFIDTAGDPEDPFKTNPTVVPDAARSGQCTRFAFSNTEGVNAEGAGDEDGCGDLTEAIAKAPNAPLGRSMPFGPVTIQCVDKDDDGLVDVFHCETWSQNEDEIDCTGSASVRAGTSSKCFCGILAGACIPFPNDDECLENVCVLRCSNSPSTPCTIGGNECTAPGFCQDTLITQNKTNGTACGDSSDTACDDPDTCVDGECQENVASSTTTCRTAVDVCDLTESCDGESPDCPADAKAPNGTACGSSSNTICDNPDTCDGSGTCQPNNEPDTTTCREAVDVCDLTESCTSGACPADAKAPDGTACGSSSDTICDNPDTCDGDGNCEENNEPNTTTCRESANGCDQPESCADGLCPDDLCRDDQPPDPFPPTP